MAVFYRLHLVCLLMLLMAHLEFASAGLRLWGLRANSLFGDPAGNEPDPYVKIWCSSSFGGMTEYHTDTAYPSWSAEFNFPNARINDILNLEVWDKDLIYDDHLGTCTTAVKRGYYVLSCPVSEGGTLFFRYKFT